MKNHRTKRTSFNIKVNVYYSLSIALPLISGTILYVLFRPDTFISKYIYQLFDRELYLSARNSPFSLFVKNHLSDILWAYSLTHTAFFIFHTERKHGVGVFQLCVSFESAIEFLQKANVLPGTFDILDVLFEICTTAFITQLINHIFKEKKHEKNN